MEPEDFQNSPKKNEYPNTRKSISGEYCKESLRPFGTCVEIVKEKVEETGLTWKKFNKLRKGNFCLISGKLRDIMIKIRESILEPTKDTIMQKAISKELLKMYLDDISTVKGFITRAQDTIDLYTFMDYYKVLRLDYKGSEFTQYVSKDDGCIYLIRFKSYRIDEAKIPFSKKFGGDTNYKKPCTGSAFTGAPEYYIVPEYILINDIPVYSAEIYEITQDGKEILKAIYKKESGKFELVND